MGFFSSPPSPIPPPTPPLKGEELFFLGTCSRPKPRPPHRCRFRIACNGYDPDAPAAAGLRTRARRGLWPHRARLHHGVRHFAHDQLCAPAGFFFFARLFGGGGGACL